MIRNPAIAMLMFGMIGAGAAPAAAGGSGVTGAEPVLGGPCEGCELVFVGLPDSIPTAARIAPADEPGEPLRITGRVVHGDGTPAPGTVVYAYHTDAGGLYPAHPDGVRHGRLRAWVRADAAGRYRFDTIRPGGYPDSAIARHVHMHVIEPGRGTYWIDSIHFTDDPRLDVTRGGDGGRGGSGILTPRRAADGTWVVVRDIVLGRGVPGDASGNGPDR